jgi:nitroreductase
MLIILLKEQNQMNETIKTILNRRSSRSFKQEQIKDEELQTILNTGAHAPSAMNQQPWHFTVVQNKEMLNKINEVCKDSFLKSEIKAFQDRAKSENFSIFYNALTYIIVTGDETAIAPQIDCALTLGNMFLAAESIGIGSCWIHAVTQLFNTDKGKALKKELGIPDGYTAFGSGAFGYKATEPNTPPRKENTINIIK